MARRSELAPRTWTKALVALVAAMGMVLLGVVPAYAGPARDIKGHVDIKTSGVSATAGQIRIELSSSATGSVIASVQTDASGNYDLGTYTNDIDFYLRFEPTAFLSPLPPSWYFTGIGAVGSRLSTDAVPLSWPVTDQQFNVVVAGGAGISGTVVDSNGDPVENLTTYALGWDPNAAPATDPFRTKYQTQTQADGSYAIYGLPPQWDYIVSWADYGTMYSFVRYPDQMVYEDTQFVDVSDNVVHTGIDATLFVEATLDIKVNYSGIPTSEYNEATTTVDVWHFDEDLGDWENFEEYGVDNTGHLLLTDLFPGFYYYVAYYEGQYGFTYRESDVISVDEGDALTVSTTLVRPDPVANIAAYHAAHGGNAGPLGAPTGAIENVPASLEGGGKARLFANASVYSSPWYGTWAIMFGPLRNKFFADGGLGFYGWPVADQVCSGNTCTQEFSQHDITVSLPPIQVFLAQPGNAALVGAAQGPVEPVSVNGGGFGQRFANASVYANTTYGTWAIMNGAIRNEFFAKGGVGGTYGWPTGAQVGTCGGITTCSQTFQNGTITIAPDPILVFLSQSGNAAKLGAAQSGVEKVLVNGGGSGQRFLNGSVYSNATYGTWAIMNGAIRNEFFAQGGIGGVYGWPTAAQVGTCGGSTTCSQTFQNGTITIAPDPIQVFLAQPGNAAMMGAAQSGVEKVLVNGGGSGQRFANGSVYANTTYGTWAIMNGAIRNEFFAKGGVGGTYGWPTGAQVGTCGGITTCSQTFQNGTITIAPDPILVFLSQSGNAAKLGAAQSGVEKVLVNGGGSGQRFLNGSVYSNATYGTWAIMNGAIRNEFFAQGGIGGVYGWPTAAQVGTCGGSTTCSQTFQNGTITIAPDPIQVFLAQPGNAALVGTAQTGVETVTSATFGNGTAQRFSKASVLAGPSGTYALMFGAIRTEYYAKGGAAKYGWPTGAQTCSAGMCSQTFSGDGFGNVATTTITKPGP